MTIHFFMILASSLIDNGSPGFRIAVRIDPPADDRYYVPIAGDARGGLEDPSGGNIPPAGRDDVRDAAHAMGRIPDGSFYPDRGHAPTNNDRAVVIGRFRLAEGLPSRQVTKADHSRRG